MIGGAMGSVLRELRSDPDAAGTIRTTYGLLADAMTAHYDGDRAGMTKAMDQVASDPNRAAAACGLLVGLLTTTPGMSAATLRQHAIEIAGPAAPPVSNDDAGSGGGR